MSKAANRTVEVPKRIHLLGSGRHEEARAAAVIKPGMLVALNSSNKVLAHASAAGWAEKMFALEDALQGRDIHTDYAQDELVSLVVASPGDVVYAWLAAGQNAAIGAMLCSNADGRMKTAGTTDIRLAVALEAADQTDTGDDAARIRVRIL